MITHDIFANQRPVWKEYKTIYTLVSRSLPFIIGVIVGGLIFSSDTDGYITNVYTELLGIIATIGIFNFFDNRSRKEEQRKRDQEQASLQLQLAKTTGDRQSILSYMDKNRLLVDVKLVGVNLDNAYLRYAHLMKSYLINASLQQANLSYAKLSGANLTTANINSAILERAFLEGADMTSANLSEANLKHAHLEGAYLFDANIDNAIFFRATLPDGTEYNPNIKMQKFINPEHPEFDNTLDKVNAIRKKMGLDITWRGFEK